MAAGAFFAGGAFFLAGFAVLPALAVFLPALAPLAGADLPARFAGAGFFGVELFGFLAPGRFAGGFLAADFAACLAGFVPVFAFFGAGLAGFFAEDRFAAAALVAVRPDAAFLGAAVFCGDAIGGSQVAERAAALPPASPGSAG
ncbi:MAG TPA: hypothetical protein VKH36_01015 [Acidimicrobiia bacterium]|nr:hypothetical protein [Acidimicrobiia bacterium]